MRESTGQVTRLLSRLHEGDEDAESELFELLSAELRGLARAVFRNQPAGHTLQPTALVNEAWLKLAGKLEPVEGRLQFMCLAGKAMRQVMIDHARGQLSQKRGGRARRVTLETGLGHAVAGEARRDPLDLIDLDASLRRLSLCNERHAQVAELRLFSGLSIGESAQALGLSTRTIDSAWAMAKAWLRRELAAPGE